VSSGSPELNRYLITVITIITAIAIDFIEPK
jgi:hypothetical protein